MLRTTVGHIKDILGIFGQCAAISDTPIPFPYVQMAKVFTIMFLYTLPFALVTELGGFTIVAVWILALGYFGLDAIATEMEDPVRVLTRRRRPRRALWPTPTRVALIIITPFRHV
jgi:predicted membrane chloride channel (bestrophin family)